MMTKKEVENCILDQLKKEGEIGIKNPYPTKSGAYKAFYEGALNRYTELATATNKLIEALKETPGVRNIEVIRCLEDFAILEAQSFLRKMAAEPLK